MSDQKRDPDDVNPGWERPSDWKFKSDWDSPNWRRQMDENFARIARKRAKFGFSVCPECGTRHTTKTITCRECEYKSLPLSIYAGVSLVDRASKKGKPAQESNELSIECETNAMAWRECERETTSEIP